MNKKIASIIIFVNLFALASFALAVDTLLDATLDSAVVENSETTNQTEDNNKVTGQAGATVTITNPLAAGGVDNFDQLLTKIITGVAGIVASLSVIMIIIAGILYLTSAGSPERIGVAKKALIYAIVGIVIAIAAESIAIIIKTTLGVT